jgi:acyl dehydratase
MEVVGIGFYFEDLPLGRRFRTIGRTVTEADIINFVNCTGMVEVLFTNTEFLRGESDIKERLAPAALSYCFAEGLLVQATMQHTGFAFLHMDFNVEKPVFAGDTIHVECEVIEGTPVAQPAGQGAGAHAQSGGEAGRHGGADLHAAAHDQVPRLTPRLIARASSGPARRAARRRTG